VASCYKNSQPPSNSWFTGPFLVSRRLHPKGGSLCFCLWSTSKGPTHEIALPRGRVVPQWIS
jgi:hypothetical protein